MNRALAAILLVAAVAGIAALANVTPNDGFPATSTGASAENQNTVLAARQLNDQWVSSFDKTGKYPDKQDPGWHSIIYKKLTTIPPDDAQNYREARALMQVFSARQTKIDSLELKRKDEAVANDSEGRKKHASYLDYVFLKDGRDARFRVSGPKNTTLEMTYILVGRPFIFKLETETQFFNDAWKAGFKKIVMRDYAGYGGNTWTFDRPKD